MVSIFAPIGAALAEAVVAKSATSESARRVRSLVWGRTGPFEATEDITGSEGTAEEAAAVADGLG
jgi:hypothetical protein